VVSHGRGGRASPILRWVVEGAASSSFGYTWQLKTHRATQVFLAVRSAARCPDTTNSINSVESDQWAALPSGSSLEKGAVRHRAELSP
jgi:hypothetical protein